MKSVINQALPVLRKYGVKKAALFGSYARGKFDQKSDVDILIEPPRNMGLAFVSLKLDLEKTLKKKVDLVSYNGISKYLRKYILMDQVPIL
jgi:predicted nucleotidyltransferase